MAYAKGVSLVLLLLLAGCQTTTPNAPSTYQGVAPDKRSYDKAEVAKARTLLAAQYIKNRQLDIAKNQLEMAFKADNRHAPAYDMMGVLLQTEGSASNLARADEYFKKAIALDGQFMQARNNYGVYLSLVNKKHEAIAQFELAGAALGYDGRVRALENLGVVQRELGNIAAAKDAFLRAIDANTGSVKARAELVDIYLQAKDVKAAKPFFDDIMMMYGADTPSAPILLQGIKIAHAQGNKKLEQRYTQQLFATYPLSDEARHLKAWLLDPSKPL